MPISFAVAKATDVLLVYKLQYKHEAVGVSLTATPVRAGAVMRVRMLSTAMHGVKYRRT